MTKQQSKSTTSTITTKSCSSKQSASSKAKADSVSTNIHNPGTDERETASVTPITPSQRFHMIEEAAYYNAERRGFRPGAETEDWLAAESVVDAKIMQHGQ